MLHHQNPPHPPRPRRLRWLALAAVTAAAVVASSAATAGAHTGTQDPVDVAVASYASDYNVTHTEAQRRLDRIQPLQDILAEIRSHETARLAGWGIDHTAAFGGWVWLTGDQPPTTDAAATADAHTDVQIRTGATHSHAELLAAQTGLFRNTATGHTTGGPESLSQVKLIVTYTDIDLRANALEIGIDPALASTAPGGLMDPDPTAVTDETLQTKITEVTALLQDHIDVAYTVKDGRGLSVTADFKGGETMHTCTSGFGAQERDTDVYGIITAGHCFRTHNNPITMHGAQLSLVVRAWGPDVDAQFRSIPTGANHRIFDDHICGTGSPCDVGDDIGRCSMTTSATTGRTAANPAGPLSASTTPPAIRIHARRHAVPPSFECAGTP